MRARMIELLRSSTLARYVLVGGVGYLFEMLVLFVASVVLHQGSAVSVTASYWLGLLFSFVLQKFFAFANTDRRLGALSAQTAMFALLVVFNYGFTLIFAALTAPIMGVFLSRTIALAITTIWNYFLYKTVIFGGVSAKAGNAVTRGLEGGMAVLARDRGLVMLAAIAVALTVVFGLMSRSASFVADDYSYLASIRESSSPFQYIVDHYLGHNGRLSQNLLVTAGFVAFGERVLKIMPFALFFSLSAAVSWVIALLLPRIDQRRSFAVVLGFVLVPVALLSLPSLFDSYLWLTSSTVYIGALAAFFVGLGLTITLARRERIPVVALVPTLIVLVLGQSFSEPVALISIAAAGLWLLVEMVRRSWKRARFAALVLAALVAGFLVVYLSPGTTTRRAAVDNPFSLRDVVIGSLDHYSTLVQNFSWWAFVLMLVAAFATALRLGPGARTRRFVLRTLLLAGTVFFASTYVVFAVSTVASPLIPYRNFTVPVVGTMLSLYLVLLVCSIGLVRLLSTPSARSVSVGALVVVAAVTVPFALTTANVQLQGLALRQSALSARAAELTDTSKGAAALDVLAAPVLVVSQAVEIENPPRKQTDWLINSFRAWHGIPQETKVAPRHTPESYCLPVSRTVKPEFTCDRTVGR